MNRLTSAAIGRSDYKVRSEMKGIDDCVKGVKEQSLLQFGEVYTLQEQANPIGISRKKGATHVI
jgi:hypothetical protein